MDNRRLLIAILLSMGVLVVWFFLFPTPPPVPGKGAPESAAPPIEGSPSAPAPSSSGTPASTGTAASTAAAAPAAPRPQVSAAAEERVVLTSPRARATFSNRGAQLVSFQLQGSKTTGGAPLELVRTRQMPLYPYGLTAGGLKPHPLDGALFETVRGADGASVTFRYSGPLGVAEKSFRFDPQGLLEVSISVEQPGWGIYFGPGIRNPTEAELKNRFERRGVVYREGDSVEVLDPQKEDGVKVLRMPSVHWVGIEDLYFLSAQIPQAGVARALALPVLVQPGSDGATFLPLPPKDQLTKEQKDLSREFAVVLEPSAPQVSLLSFWGAKAFDDLKALDDPAVGGRHAPYGLEGAVRLGTFGFLARPLLAGLHWIHDHIVGNYGWAIILMTILIKLILLPFTHRSTLSMRKMQKLNPRMQSIRERYRPKLRDKQGRPNLEMQRKMDEETMALYKQEGVNPAGGCLPLLLQMPVLFAFYTMLSTAVELRGAPWILWIQNLAAQDPYYVLPIVMGVSQFLQVRMTPQAGDPMQRRIFQIVPLFWTILFFSFPSGLVLYWLTNNILTIAQQAIYNRMYREA